MFIKEPDSIFPESCLSGYPRIQLGKDITIGMSAYGNYETTRDALTALFLSIEGDYELILVDDCSPDSTLELFCRAADYHENTRIFAVEKNLEYSGSLNAILSHATGRFIFFISNDIFVTPAYITTLLEVAIHSEEYGIIRGCSNFVDNGKELYNVCKEKSFNTFEELFSTAAEIRGRSRYELADDDFLTGDAFLVSRKLLDSIGTLDPLFYGYFCDHDLGVRARRAGFSPVLARGAFAAHMHTANFDYLPDEEKTAKNNRRWGRVYENWARFKLKYGLPVDLQYFGVRNIPWADITNPTDPQELFQYPGDYIDQCIYAPDKTAAYANTIAKRAKAFFYVARLEEGENLCRWGLMHYPDNPAILASLATILTYQCRVDEAVDLFRLALSGKDKDVKTYSSLLLAMNYSEKFTQKEIYEESCKWNETFCRPSEHKPESKRSHPAIRIGLVSGDFRRHSVTYFLEPLLKNIDKKRFEIFCYSDVDFPDTVTERFRKLSDVWHDTSNIVDEDLANLIRSDEVDILVDLAGHSGRRIRLPVFCHRPAPVQVSWLGYPNTSGLSAIQFRITDEIVDPPGQSDGLHTEKLIRLPGGFICYSPPAESPVPSPPPFLKNGFITFGSFNMLSKLSPTTILIWAKILRRIKESRLLLKCHYYSDPATTDRIKKYFSDFGIKADRVELRPATSGYFEHLEAYNEVDIALDTFPYNGTTTTCEALWMGVPVVTRYGDRHSSRVGLSILTMLGHEEFAKETNDAYCATVCGLASDPELLGNIRKSLRIKMLHSRLCDELSFVRNMESFFMKAVGTKLIS
jgi:predicted O-linked N-acetylglucosamine transferase (SPINDLY family)/GT2 family glycosyltransferase